jgi:small subunit ribosomal protein S5
MFKVPLVASSIPHDVFGHFGAGKVLLRPASAGTGVIAGGAVRAVVESAGIHDILTKCLGSSNPHNVVRATVSALKMLKAAENIAGKRDKSVDEVTPKRRRGEITAGAATAAPAAPTPEPGGAG